MPEIHGRVDVGEVPPGGLSGTLRVRLVEVGRADAKARIVAEQVIEDVVIAAVSDHPEFTMSAPPSGSTREVFAIEAHLDRDGSGETSIGDFRSMQRYTVRPGDRAGGAGLTIRLRRVT